VILFTENLIYAFLSVPKLTNLSPVSFPGVEPFGWIAKGCQLVVTGHEIGHNFGCLHNKEQHVGQRPPAYFEGFEYGNLVDDPVDGRPTGYATIMR
jgi:hypothetical protein